MTKTIYICEGSCNGTATEEEWKEGARTCGARECELHGKPLQKRNQCEKCKEIFTLKEKHHC